MLVDVGTAGLACNELVFTRDCLLFYAIWTRRDTRSNRWRES